MVIDWKGHGHFASVILQGEAVGQPILAGERPWVLQQLQR